MENTAHAGDDYECERPKLKEEPGISDGESSDPLEVAGSSNDSLMFSLEKDEIHSTSSEGTGRKHTSVVNELVKAVMEKLNSNPKCSNNQCSDTMRLNDYEPSQKIKRRRKRFALRKTSTEQRRKRYDNETDEERQFRLLRQRMITIKQRLIKRLEMPEDYKKQQDKATQKRRMKKKIILAKETPEQAEERRRRNREQIRISRQRIREIETPEQQNERRIKKALQGKALKSLETPEQRAARLERDRGYLKKKRERQKNEKQIKAKVSPKTGKIYIRESRKIKMSAEEEKEDGEGVTKLDAVSLEANNALGVTVQSDD